MKQELHIDGNMLRAKLSGDFTFTDNNEFREVIKSTTESEIKGVELDVRDITYMDSAALGMLLLVKEEADKKNIRVRLNHPSERVRKTLDLARFNTLFDII